ncbi:MAG TPA: hypothetical protein VFI12_10410 [Thermomicrobiales bacterium]|nr:hypothetical protein [Thermomicrobiales bacterium]
MTDVARPVLSATVHDPDGRFLPLLSHVAASLAWYRSAAFAVTDETDARIATALESLGAEIIQVATGAIGTARRAALRRSAERCHEAGILACDFDRWLHWARHYSRELRCVPERIAAIRPAPWYVCIGRSARAFATHPQVQRDAEAATNHALEIVVGFPIDAVAGACWLSPEGLSQVLDHSCEATAATDLEWPAIVHRREAARLAAIQVEGLEFETPSFYQDQVVLAGSVERWIGQTYERPEMWQARLQLAADSVAALTREMTPDQ